LGLNDQELGEHNPHNSFRGYMIDPMKDFALELGRLAGRLVSPFRWAFPSPAMTRIQARMDRRERRLAARG
jgi:hypothetical protein